MSTHLSRLLLPLLLAAPLGLGCGDDDDDAPVVSVTASTTTVSEAEGTAITFNFTVEGDIPSEGITVRLESDADQIMREFTAAQVRFDDDLNLNWRFDDSVGESAVGGDIGRGSMETDPDNPGFLSAFEFTITEATASVTFDVLDDILEEADQSVTYTVVEGDGYTVDAANSSVGFTITDGVDGGSGPTVGVTASPTELLESEQTRIELSFTVDGEIPAEGLVVELSSDEPRAVAEFDINAANPRLPEEEFTVEGLVTEGGTVVGSNEIASALVFRITSSPATLSVEVFDGDDVEGLETFTYVLRDGEEYQVDAANSEATISIDE
ncbi:MAG: hypothetical protein AAGA56_26830 [Myxococcota bacterium]